MTTTEYVTVELSEEDIRQWVREKTGKRVLAFKTIVPRFGTDGVMKWTLEIEFTKSNIEK